MGLVDRWNPKNETAASSNVDAVGKCNECDVHSLDSAGIDISRIELILNTKLYCEQVHYMLKLSRADFEPIAILL